MKYAPWNSTCDLDAYVHDQIHIDLDCAILEIEPVEHGVSLPDGLILSPNPPKPDTEVFMIGSPHGVPLKHVMGGSVLSPSMENVSGRRDPISM